MIFIDLKEGCSKNIKNLTCFNIDKDYLMAYMSYFSIHSYPSLLNPLQGCPYPQKLLSQSLTSLLSSVVNSKTHFSSSISSIWQSWLSFLKHLLPLLAGYFLPHWLFISISLFHILLYSVFLGMSQGFGFFWTLL